MQADLAAYHPLENFFGTRMVPVALTKAVVATTRFGFAAKEGELVRVARDPQGWVLLQLDRPPVRLDGDLPAAAPMVAAMLEARRNKSEEGRRQENQRLRAIYLAELEARVKVAATTDAPFLERLTYFWSNHFTVSCVRPVIRGFAGAFEREAIRPHVTGRFVDMLLAAERHPAMLFYLDQVMSIGPNSVAGLRLHRGINENFGREMLELHTLGVNGGYTQADVDALAEILTGWSIARLRMPDAGSFHFYPQLHEPGSKVLLGKTYRENGCQEGVEALHALASHPATARHIATKLAIHFIADQPPHGAVERIAAVFRETNGDLKQVTAAVVHEKAAWETPFAKIRTPNDLVVAASRVTGFVPPAPLLAYSLRGLNQMPFFAPQPEGWADDASHWVNPESVLRRAAWCQIFAARVPEPGDPVECSNAIFGEMLPAEAVQAIRRAPSRREALALLLATPEFQRR
jgi:uncharacterized protein (DUF1800 family)